MKMQFGAVAMIALLLNPILSSPLALAATLEGHIDGRTWVPAFVTIFDSGYLVFSDATSDDPCVSPGGPQRDFQADIDGLPQIGVYRSSSESIWTFGVKSEEVTHVVPSRAILRIEAIEDNRIKGELSAQGFETGYEVSGTFVAKRCRQF